MECKQDSHPYFSNLDIIDYGKSVNELFCNLVRGDRRCRTSDIRNVNTNGTTEISPNKVTVDLICFQHLRLLYWKRLPLFAHGQGDGALLGNKMLGSRARSRELTAFCYVTSQRGWVVITAAVTDTVLWEYNTSDRARALTVRWTRIIAARSNWDLTVAPGRYFSYLTGQRFWARGAWSLMRGYDLQLKLYMFLLYNFICEYNKLNSSVYLIVFKIDVHDAMWSETILKFPLRRDTGSLNLEQHSRLKAVEISWLI